LADLVADGLPTYVVTHQLQVECRTGKVRRSQTDVLPLCHTTNRIVVRCVLTVELYNSQMMLRGCETNGYVIACAGKASLLACDHRPVWVRQQLQSKSTLVGSIDAMQVAVPCVL